jgi:hypothetical protein
MRFNKEYKEQLNLKLVHFCAFDYFLWFYCTIMLVI